MVFGILHNVLELRYVTGRFRSLLRGRFVAVVLGLVTVVALARLAGGQGARRVELVVGFGILAVGLLRGGAGRAALFAAGLAVSWATARTSYVALASYHAYVEYAVLAAFVAGLPAGSRHADRTGPETLT